jgi:hypothetical protein
LENETASAVAGFAAMDHLIEGQRDVVSGFAGNFHPVVAEDGRVLLAVNGKEEFQGFVTRNQVFDGHTIHRLLQLGVEIVNPEFVEVAEHDVGRAMRDEVEPVIKRLPVVARKFFTARFHFDEHTTRPDKVRVLGAIAGKPDAILKG